MHLLYLKRKPSQSLQNDVVTNDENSEALHRRDVFNYGFCLEDLYTIARILNVHKWFKLVQASLVMDAIYCWVLPGFM